jgi:hypothetical protein
MIRFVHLFNYAKDVSKKDGEAWYLGKHVPQVKKLPGIVRYCSWKQVDVGIPFPSPGAPTPFDQFVRRTELCFDTLPQALKAVMGNPRLWSPSEKGMPGFREFECMFLVKEAEFNLLQDTPQQQYKYMMLPLWWPRGRPQVEENEEIFIDSYCISYMPDISVTDGEDWYLGHHTREGKQLPGMKHYKTWRTIRVPEEPNSALHPNKWYRLTELGMDPIAYKVTMVNQDTRIRFTQSPLGRVIGGWLNISIKLDLVDDLM